MRLPRVNPIGLVEHPEEFIRVPRSYPRGLRLAAAIALSAFVVVMVTTTVYSLGGYCLTSHAGAPIFGSFAE